MESNEEQQAPTSVGPVAPVQPRVIDRIRAAFNDRPWSIEVPEWAAVLYFHPMTVADLEVAAKGVVRGEGETPDDTHERNLKLLIHKAKDVNGAPVFLPGDLHYLKTECRIQTLQRVVNFMYACGSLSPKEAEDAIKN